MTAFDYVFWSLMVTVPFILYKWMTGGFDKKTSFPYKSAYRATYTPKEYKELADFLRDGLDAPFLDMEKIIIVFQKLNHRLDYDNLKKAFGNRRCSFTGSIMDMEQWLKDSLSHNELLHLKRISRDKTQDYLTTPDLTFTFSIDQLIEKIDFLSDRVKALEYARIGISERLSNMETSANNLNKLTKKEERLADFIKKVVKIVRKQREIWDRLKKLEKQLNGSNSKKDS